MESSAGSGTDPARFDDPANLVSPDGSAIPIDSATSVSPATPASEQASTDIGSIVMDRWLRRLLRRRGAASRAARPLTARKARVILVCLAVLAAAFASTTAFLANRALSASGAGSPTSAAPLIRPAPTQAAGLPRHYRLTADQRVLLAIAQFRQRFTVLRQGSAASYPEAFYAEPGRIDLASDTGGWVMYLGYNAPASLGDPAGTTSRLMAALAGQAPARSWQVPAGAQGGTARCMIAVVGLMRMSVCGWATDRTVAAVMSPAGVTSTNELATLMPIMRLDLQPG